MVNAAYTFGLNADLLDASFLKFLMDALDSNLDMLNWVLNVY